MDTAELQKDLLIAEYGALNADIQRRLSDRFYLAFGTLTAGVSLVSVPVPGYALFAYPVACWLVSLWMLHNEISIKRKNVYLRKLEAMLPDGYGFLRSKRLLNSGALSTDKLNIETVINRIVAGCAAGITVIGILKTMSGTLSLATCIISAVFVIPSIVAIVAIVRNDYVRRERKGE